MPTIEEVKEEWKKDSSIDNTRFETELIRTPMLHAKYLDYLVYFRAKRAATLRKLNTLKAIKRRYYRGEFTLDELKEHGWGQWQGLKPSMSELNQLFDQDADLIEIEERLEYYNTALAMIEYIMKAIGSRGYEMKTLLDYQKFINGG
jgi:hypothetical protein